LLGTQLYSIRSPNPALCLVFSSRRRGVQIHPRRVCQPGGIQGTALSKSVGQPILRTPVRHPTLIPVRTASTNRDGVVMVWRAVPSCSLTVSTHLRSSAVPRTDYSPSFTAKAGSWRDCRRALQVVLGSVSFRATAAVRWSLWRQFKAFVSCPFPGSFSLWHRSLRAQ